MTITGHAQYPDSVNLAQDPSRIQAGGDSLIQNLEDVLAKRRALGPGTVSDTLPLSAFDSLRLSDQTLTSSDSLSPPSRYYTISPDALEAEVKYKMKDSMHYSIVEQKIYLYGEAEVIYEDITLTAGKMIIDYNNNILVAEPVVDSLGKQSQLPNFKQGPQAFEAKGMRYNFKTRKGIIYNATTQQGDLYVLGEKTKLVVADPNDPGRNDNTVYNQGAIITTCDLDHPHYGIRSNKQKVIPNKQVIVGPSNVELGGVPTPLWLPFGFFPIGSSERSGLIFPTDYQYDDINGFGFQNVGWYFPINDYLHTSVTSDIFLRGTTRLYVSGDYKRAYKYNGSFNLSISRNRQEIEGIESFDRSYALRVSHNQDQKANPYRNLRANIQFQTNNFSQQVGRSFESQVTSTFRSNASYTIKFPSFPSWNLTSGFTHSQNTRTGIHNLDVPNVSFSTGAIYPFAKLGNKASAWYKKAVINYDADFRGNVTATDSTILTAEPWRDILLGGQQSATFSAPVNIFKYFRLSPNIRYSSTAFFDEFSRFYESNDTTIVDSIFVDSVFVGTTSELVRRGEVRDTLINGFNMAHSFNANLSLSTNLFGTARFKLGKLRGIRHIMTPSVSIGYTPDYSSAPFDYYRDVQVNPEGEFESYLAFPNRPFSPGSLPDRESFNASYSLGNRLETKLFDAADSTTSITSLINNLTFSGSYNFSADSLQWSTINVNGAQATFFKKIVRVTVNGALDMYELDETGRRTPTTLLSAGKGLLRLDRFNVRLGAQLSMLQLRELITGEKEKPSKSSIFSLIENFRISYNYARNFNSRSTREKWTTSANSINASGSIPISEKWSLSAITVGYDLRSQSITYPSIALQRDLHCWVMDFFWAPRINTFNFSIRVKPSSLGFLELPYRRGILR